MMIKTKRLLIATFFNLAFEYSLRGFINIKVMPVLPLILFASYFTLFAMIEDLIVRFRLKDYHLIILSFFYGTIYDSWISGVNFLPPLVLGVNWINLFIINIFWWGLLQAVLTFYFAGRIFPRDWSEPFLSKRGWFVCLMIQTIIIVLFQKSGAIVYGSGLGRLTILFILLFVLFLFRKTVSGRELLPPNQFFKSRFLDFLSFATLIFFLFCALSAKNLQMIGTSLISPVNYKIVSRWTFILGLFLIFYRIKTKKEIPV